MHDKILIIDFGSQVTQLIARRVREEGVRCVIVPLQKAREAFAAMKPRGVILSGGPASVLDADAPLPPSEFYHAGLPVLGICYGEQAMAHQLGGEVEGGHHREFGRAEVEVTEDCALFDGIWRKGERYPVWMSHGDRVTRLPAGFRVVGTSANAPIAMIADERRRFYATQFHLEVIHTPHGAALLRNFVRKNAGCKGDWTMRAFKAEAIEKIRAWSSRPCSTRPCARSCATTRRRGACARPRGGIGWRRTGVARRRSWRWAHWPRCRRPGSPPAAGSRGRRGSSIPDSARPCATRPRTTVNPRSPSPRRGRTHDGVRPRPCRRAAAPSPARRSRCRGSARPPRRRRAERGARPGRAPRPGRRRG